jgi:hypothetical protein
MVMMMREAEMTGVKGNRNDENASPLEGEGNACGASEGEGAGAVKLQPKRDSTLANASLFVPSPSAPDSAPPSPSKGEGVPRATNGRFLSRKKATAPAQSKRKTKTKTKMSKATALPWTAEKRLTFLAALAATSNVTKSAAAAGMSDAQVYAERRRNAGFRDAWTDALSEGYARLEFMMLERANDALSVKGKVTDDKLAKNKMHEYSNKLALNLLTAHRALVREARAGAAPSRHTPNRVAGSKARLIAKLDEMRARSSG